MRPTIHSLTIHELLLRGIRRAAKERLSIDSFALLKLLLHLIRYHLLTESNLPQLHRAVVIVFASTS